MRRRRRRGGRRGLRRRRRRWRAAAAHHVPNPLHALIHRGSAHVWAYIRFRPQLISNPWAYIRFRPTQTCVRLQERDLRYARRRLLQRDVFSARSARSARARVEKGRSARKIRLAAERNTSLQQSTSRCYARTALLCADDVGWFFLYKKSFTTCYVTSSFHFTSFLR